MADEGTIEMRAMMARWEALRERWALTAEEEADLLGGGGGLSGEVGTASSWGACRLEQRMRMLIDLGGALDRLLLYDGRIRRWLRRPMDSIGDRSPIEAMSTSIEWIRALRRAALDFAA